LSAVELVAGIVTSLAAELRAADYKKSGTMFYRRFDRGLRLLGFQRSRWSSAAEAQFTINLCVYYPALIALDTDEPRLPLPTWPPAKHRMPTLAERNASPSTRIGQVMLERRDHWWSVTDGSDPSPVHDAVVGAIHELGIPWLDHASDLAWLASYYRGFSLRAAARCYVLLGDLAAARDALLAWTREDYVTPEATERALRWGRIVGVDV